MRSVSRVRFTFILAAVFLVGVVSASINPMLALYLLREVQASPVQLSGVLAALNVSGLVFSLALGALADRQGHLSQIFTAASAAAFACYVFLAGAPPLWHATLSLVVLGGPALSVISLMFGRLRQFGLPESQVLYARAAFSLSWIAGPAIGAFLVQDLGFAYLFLGAAVASLAGMLGVLTLLPQRLEAVAPAASEEVSRASSTAGSSGLTVTAMVAAFVCLQAVNSATVSYLPILVAEIRGLELSWPGIALGLCASLEVVVLYLMGRFSNFGMRKTTAVAIGAASGLAYVIGLAVLPSVAALLALQVFNAIFVATVHGVGMTWFQELSSARPGLMTAIYMNTSRLGALVAAPVLGTQQFGVGGLMPLATCAALALAGLLAVVWLASRSSRFPASRSRGGVRLGTLNGESTPLSVRLR